MNAWEHLMRGVRSVLGGMTGSDAFQTKEDKKAVKEDVKVIKKDKGVADYTNDYISKTAIDAVKGMFPQGQTGNILILLVGVLVINKLLK